MPDPFLCQMCPVISGNTHFSSPRLGHKLKSAFCNMQAFIDIGTVMLEAGGCVVPVDIPSQASTKNS